MELNKARYDYYRVYRINVNTDEQVKIFQDIEKKSDSYTFYGHSRNVGQKLTILVAAHKIDELTNILNSYNVEHKILTYNFQEKIDKESKNILPKDIALDKFDWNHYFHLETIYGWLEKQANEYDYVTLLNIGNSHEGIPIKGIKIAKNPSNPTVFIESGIHAREWIATASATYILNELLTSKDTKVQKYLDCLNWIIFPSVNPDGYKYSFENDRMWRKNRTKFGLDYGVDLNRNYPFHWNEIGSSSNPPDYDFSGTSAASEPETKCIVNFVQKILKTENIKIYLALHSFSQLIMFPYGTEDKVDNYNDLMELGEKASSEIKKISGREYKVGNIYETIYPSSGGSTDWAKSIGIPITFTFELRGPPDTPDLFILPADQIKETGQEIFAGIMTIVDEADKKNYFKN